MARHEILRERLARFERSGGLRRADDRATSRGEQIDDATTERQFGTDDRQIDAFAIGRREQAPGLQRRRDTSRDARDAGISRSANHLSDARSAPSFHAIACSRAPAPMTRIFMRSEGNYLPTG